MPTIRHAVPALFLALAGALPAAVPVHPEFGVPVLRDPAQWPYEREDPFNLPLGADATYAPIEDPDFHAILEDAEHPHRRWRAGTMGTSDFPIHLCSAGRHPLRKVIHQKHGLVVEMPVPDEAVRAKSVDYHLVLIPEERGDWYIEFYKFTRHENGDVGIYPHKNALRGSTVYPTYHGCRAWGGSGLAGLIRAGELELGIRHALNLNMPVTVHGGETWPAVNGDGDDPSSALRMGCRLAIPPWVDIRAIAGDSGPLYELARALQDYGGYLTDSVGSHHQALRIDAEHGYQTAVDLNRGWQLGKLTPHLHLVTNADREHPAGPGRPRRPLAPDFTPPGHPGAPPGQLVVRATDREEEREQLAAERAAEREARLARRAAERGGPTREPATDRIEAWRAALRARVETGLATQGELRFDLRPGAGARLVSLAGDQAVLRMLVPGSPELRLPWTRLSPPQCYGLALAVVDEHDPEDQALAAAWAFLADQPRAGHEHLRAAGDAGAAVAAVFGLPSAE